jgi:hypothetical protein
MFKCTAETNVSIHRTGLLTGKTESIEMIVLLLEQVFNNMTPEQKDYDAFSLWV